MLRIIQTAASTYGQQQQYVPLKNVTIKANIESFAADVTIKQIFCNNESLPIEAVYCFPIEEQAAIYSFIAKIDDRQIIAQLKEKKQAQQEYNQALQQGHGAYLLEQDKKSQDNFIINIGALPPGKECHIEISYVTELDLVQNGTKIRFVIPTTIAPRYNPNKGGITSPAGTTTNYVQLAPYTIDLHCQIDKLNIARISSTSHPIQIDLSHQDIYVIEFGQQNTHLDRDILIDIELEENRSNTILAVESGAVMASFTPNQQDCQHAIDNREVVTNEFIFIVDCSGSMRDENKIGYARQAMLLFLKSLPLNCHFNIIRFGSTYESLFKDITVVYNKEHAQQAEQLTNNMQANLGGTELLLPLQWLNEHPSKESRARQIFLLTDGEISNVDEVLDLCRSMSSSTRIFSFGLGRSPSRSLVKGLARATNGHFVFIPPDTNVDVYVGEQLEKALQSSITNIQVKWNLGRNVTNVPTTPPPVYVNNRLIVYALITDDNNESGVFDHNSSVELYNDKHRLGEAKVNRIPNVVDNGTISRLAGKALILELQHSKLSSSSNQGGSRQTRFEEETKKRVIELSLKYNILSPYTAFVGIEKRVNGNNADMVLREVPIEISADDQHLQISQCRNLDMSRNSNSSRILKCKRLIASHHFSIVNSTSRCLKDAFNDEEDSLKSCSANNYIMRESSEIFLPSSDTSVARASNSTVRGARAALLNQSMMSKFIRIIEQFLTSYKTTLSRLLTFTSPNRSTSSDSNVKCLNIEKSNVVHQYDSYNAMNDADYIKNESNKEETFPADDENIVRYLINKQMFDGHWELNSQVIEQLTSKPLSHFQQSTNSEVLITAIVIIVLETRFTSFSSMWHGVVQKARQHLLGLLGNDSIKLNQSLEAIRQQL